VEQHTSPIPEAAEAPVAVRERGWRLILPALGLFLLVPAFAALRILFPVEQTILLVGPAIGVCALVAWVQGGRVWLALTWLVLSAWMLLRPLDSGSAFEFMARGWALSWSRCLASRACLAADGCSSHGRCPPLQQRSFLLGPLCWCRTCRQGGFSAHSLTN
jgi:hypothetical protein